MDYLTTHTSLSPIRSGFAPGFVNYKKGCTRLAAASDKVYQLLAYSRWFSPGTPASSTIETGRHDIADILLKVALNNKNQSITSYKKQELYTFSSTFVYTRFSVGSVLLIYSVFCVVLFVFGRFLVCLMLKVSLDCPFSIDPSVFSGLSILDLSVGFLLTFICPMFCVSNVVSVFGLSISIDPSVFSNVYL